MDAFRTYSLTILLHPQATTAERSDVESTVRSWVEERQGTVTNVAQDQKRRLAYPVHHVQQATVTLIRFQTPAGSLSDLQEKLRREKKVLRFAIHAYTPRTEAKTLKDIPLRPAAPEKAPAGPKKEKAAIGKLDEKIEEILEEEVL